MVAAAEESRAARIFVNLSMVKCVELSVCHVVVYCCCASNTGYLFSRLVLTCFQLSCSWTVGCCYIISSCSSIIISILNKECRMYERHWRLAETDDTEQSSVVAVGHKSQIRMLVNNYWSRNKFDASFSIINSSLIFSDFNFTGFDSIRHIFFRTISPNG